MKVGNFLTGLTAGSAVLLIAAPGQVAAQGQSASAAAMLEEVVVTARRREESLQDLPLSIAAITADTMQAQGIYDIKDITGFVPNVAFRSQDRRDRISIFIRGIGSGGPGSFRPVGSGLYIDGHYRPNNNGQLLSTMDIERIEVLRGPQGTLFGKNTTGGAVQIITAKPQQEFQSEILLRAADFGQQDFRGMINVPFSDTIAGRFAVAKETSDGYYFNRNLNKDYGGIDVEAISAALRFTPNDNWLIDLTFRSNEDDSDNMGGTCRPHPTQEALDALAADGQDASAYTAFADGISQWGGFNGGVGHVDRIYRGATLDFWDNCALDNQLGDFVTSSEKDGFVKLENLFYNATAEWDSGGEVGGLDNLNVKFIAGRFWSNSNNWADRDYTPVSIDAIGSHISPGQERATESFEVIFSADVNDRLSFTAGVHLFDDLAELGEQDCLNTLNANFAALNDPTSGFSIECSFDGGTQFDRLGDRLSLGGPAVGAMSGYLKNESQAVFAHLTYDINDNWTLDAGARWTDEDRFFESTEFNTVSGTCIHGPAHYLNNPNLPRAPATGPANPGAPPRTEICAPTYLLTYNDVFAEGFYNNVGANFSEVTPMVSLTRQLAPGDTLESGMMYVTISEGFLTGAFNDELNTTLVPELAPLLSYGPEFVTNYEFGFKGTMADGRLQLATSIFYMDYTDKQEEIEIDNSDGRFGGDPQVAIVTNAATVDIFGIEFELRASPWDGGFVSLDVGWLDNEYGAFTSFDPDAPGGTVDRSNLAIEDFSPEWTVNASIEHQFLLGNGATLTPQLGVYFQDDFEWEAGLDQNAPPSVCFQESYAVFRARATYQPADGAWQASLFGSNIGDERYYDYCDAARAGAFDYRYGQPDTWGMEFVYRWGN